MTRIVPRTARASQRDVCYHVMNRGNARAVVFHAEQDYRGFEILLGRACARLPMRILAWCLMPNHFHLLLHPHGDGDLGRWMHWLLTSHVVQHGRRYNTCGRIWQGRFKAFPIQADSHLLVVMRYVERNPVRAGIVERAEAWRWSSLAARSNLAPPLLSAAPVSLPGDWTAWVNAPVSDNELEEVRCRVQRARPYGDPVWERGTAERLGLLDTVRARGRPRSTLRV